MATPCNYITLLLIISVFMLIRLTNAYHDVVSYGAKPDGATDSTKAFLRAWEAACSSSVATSIHVPNGTYLLKATVFQGPCKSRIGFRVDGTLVAPSDYQELGDSGYWILFIQVNNIRFLGGTLDARAFEFWACRKSGKDCPSGARSITFYWANNVRIRGLTSLNSQMAHIVISYCKNVVVKNVTAIAPENSLNTDGIHIQGSVGVTVSCSTLQTGDDCISIGPGTEDLFMTNITCGPGHGVSIGSLGWDYEEDGVKNVTLTNSVFSGSDNGVRIKSWARPTTSFVNKVLFQNLIMKNVMNPIIIDQNYCPYYHGCPIQSSGVKISGVTYKNIRGTSATQDAVIFDCSETRPCQRIKLQDINLTYILTKPATSSCNNINGTTSGVVIPKSCL